MQTSVIVPIRHADLAFVAGFCAHKPLVSRHELLALALHTGIDLVRNNGLEAVGLGRGQSGRHPSSDPHKASGVPVQKATLQKHP